MDPTVFYPQTEAVAERSSYLSLIPHASQETTSLKRLINKQNTKRLYYNYYHHHHHYIEETAEL